MNHDPNHQTDPGGNSRMRIAFFVMLAIAVFFLLTEHRAHALGVLPFLLLLACPLMHLFGHHGHGHRHRDTDRGKQGEGPASPHLER